MSSFRKPLKVQDPDVFQIVKGQKVKIRDGALRTIMASVQPISLSSYDAVKTQLDGARIERVILVTTSANIKVSIADEHTGTQAGFFLWQSRRYRNMMVREGFAGVIPHIQYYAVQEQDKG